MREDIAIGWNGLPAYGARLIKAAQDDVGAFPVLATRPTVPIEGMEAILGRPVHWVDEDARPRWSDFGLEIPKIYFQTGWGHAPLNALGAEVRANGGKVVAMVDNPWRRTLRQMVGAIVFRFKYRNHFSAIMVPGKRARQLCRIFGVPHERIYEGMYGGDPEIFKASTALDERSKRFIFVGQFIERKGVLELAEAFRQLGNAARDWSLLMVGSGPLEAQLRSYSLVEVRPFAQPEQIAALLADSRCLVLPSREEHWGLVVHEAALSGCQLVLSHAVGAGSDLLEHGLNGFGFKAVTADEIAEALKCVIAQNDSDYSCGSEYSLECAKAYGPARWANEFNRILDSLEMKF